MTREVLVFEVRGKVQGRWTRRVALAKDITASGRMHNGEPGVPCMRPAGKQPGMTGIAVNQQTAHRSEIPNTH